MALAPWIAVLRGASVLAGLASGFLLGTASGLISNPWLAGALARLGAEPPGPWAGAAVIAVWGSGVPWALVGGVAAAGYRLSAAGHVLALAAAMVAVDTGRGWIPGALPWGLLGHTQWTLQGVAQVAALGGVPLLSGLVMAVNAALARTLLTRRDGVAGPTAAARMLGASAGAYAAIAGLGLATAEALRPPIPAADSVSFLVMQPTLHPRERWSPLVQRTNLAHLTDATAQAIRGSDEAPGIVLWPENTLTRPLDADPELRGALEGQATRLGVPVVLGAVRSGSRDNRYRSSVLRVDPNSGVADALDKTQAIPFVESAPRLPGQGSFSRLALGLSSKRSLVEEGRGERPLRGRPELAALLCNEALFPGLVDSRRSAQTAAIVVLGTDTWFPSAQASQQQIAFASFRAIEQRLWLLRAAEGGGSAVIDPFGRVVQQLPFGRPGHLRAEIPPQVPPTLAERAALAGLLAAGAAVGVAATSLFHRRRSP